MTTKVKAIPNGSLAEDGSHAILNLVTEEGSEIALEFSSQGLRTTARLFGALSAKAQDFENAAKGRQIVRAQDTAGFRASAVASENKLILSFKTRDGLEHHFSVPAQFADEIRKRIREAERNLKRPAPGERH
jgi:hypothetical protein